MKLGPARIGLAGLVAASLFLLLPTLARAADPGPRPFADWTAVVIAGDWRASGGQATDAFDNARRDVAKALADRGFAPANILQFSLKPAAGDQPAPTARDAMAAFMARTVTANAGCLFYVTTHGDPTGVALGPDVKMSPEMLRRVLAEACAGRPTVAVISACYSGVFLDPLAAGERLVLTAARRDRSSFGCGVHNRYPWFDECFLQSLSSARDFADLGRRSQACIAAREKAERATPPSEPQLSVGAQFPLLAPRFPSAGQ